MGAVTMKSLAHQLGVSITTISNAYNHPDRLSEELRTKILETGESLGYSGPDAAGRLLRSGRAMAVGVVCGSGYSFAFDDPYTMVMFRGLSRVLEAEGVALHLLATGDPSEGEAGAEAVSRAIVDCFVHFTQRTDSPAVLMAKKRGVPVIYTNMVPGASYVAVDDRRVGRLIGEHAASLGHQNVAVLIARNEAPTLESTCLSCHASVTAPQVPGLDGVWRDRIDGIVETMPGARVTLVPVEQHTPEGVTEALDKALEDEVTFIACLSDRVALMVLDLLEARRVKVGDEVSVLGVDGIDEALERRLTTVRQPTYEKGLEVGRLALDPLAEPRQILLPVDLVPGRTTGPAPG